MQWVVEDERRAPFRLTFEALDASIQEGAKSAGPSVVETQHRSSEEEAQDACVSAVAGKEGGQGSRTRPPDSIYWKYLRFFPRHTHHGKTSNMAYMIHGFARHWGKIPNPSELPSPPL